MSKPTNHTVWVTDGDTNHQVQPQPGKQLTGWVVNDKPPFQTWNWLHWNAWQWETYFEAITDTHTTQIAALTSSVAAISSASGITASNTGHTTMTGTNVQTQLDQADAAFKNIFDALTGGEGIDLVGYVPVAPSNWSPAPTHAGPALDQLASRLKVVELATQGNSYIDKSFPDYVIPAARSDGAGNTGLTDTLATNPRGIKLADLKHYFGEERIQIQRIQLTGNYDANGKPEHMVVTPQKDIRIMLYGSWYQSHNGALDREQADTNGLNVLTNIVGDYALVTGFFDSIALQGLIDTTIGPDQIQVELDTVNLGVNLSTRGSNVLHQHGNNVGQIICDPAMINFGQDLHTVKFINQSSDANTEWILHGFVLVNGTQTEMAGNMFLSKGVINLTKQSFSNSGVGINGGKVVRWVDRADSTRKDAVQNCLSIVTGVTGGLSSGTTSFSLNSGTGWQIGDIALITDGPTNCEKVILTAVNVISGAVSIPSPGLVNSYTNPTVRFYAKAATAVNHSNEQVKLERAMRQLMEGPFTQSPGAMPAYGSSNTQFKFQLLAMDGNTGISGGDWLFDQQQDPLTPFTSRGEKMAPGGAQMWMRYEGVFSGLDVLLAVGVASSAMAVIVDGVITQTVTFSGTDFGQRRWRKIVSDLPQGHHTVMLVSLAAGADFGVQKFREYELKDPSAVVGLPAGDIISKRDVLGDYFFDNTGLTFANNAFAGSEYFRGYGACSQGMVRQGFWNNSVFKEGTGGSSDWAIQGNTTAHIPSIYCHASNRTNAYVERWFFGKGLDIYADANSNFGIALVEVDGQAVTVANFPSLVAQGAGQVPYNTGNGHWDTYNVNHDPNGGTISLAGLFATPGWHKLRITNTGTKNGSSSDFFISPGGIGVHGMPFQNGFIPGNNGLSAADFIGGVKDLRSLSASVNTARNWARCLPTSGTSMTIPSGVRSVIADLVTSLVTKGGPVKIDAYFVGSTAGAITNQYEILVDGEPLEGEVTRNSTSGSDITIVSFSALVDLPPGLHTFHVLTDEGGAGNNIYFGRDIIVEERQLGI